MKRTLFDLLPDGDILLEEYTRFKAAVKAFPVDAPYYVYALCLIDGTPFYVGKGKNRRAWDHLFDHVRGTQSNKGKHSVIDYLISEVGEYPVVHIISSGMTNDAAYKFEAEAVKRFGKVADGGILVNVLDGGNILDHEFVISSAAGKIGGSETRRREAGIFSKDWDRAAETRRRRASPR